MSASVPRADAMVRSLVATLLGVSLLAGCAPSEQEAEFLARRALLQRQNQGIRDLIAEEERGSLVPADRFLIGIDESVLGDLFRSQLPLERPLGKRFVMRLDSAAVSLRDKFGAVTIEGSVHRPKTPDRRTAVRIFGGLDSVAIDPATGTLHVKIAIDHIDILQAGILEGVLGRGGRKFIAQVGRPMIQDAIPRFEIPVVLGRSIRVPPVEAAGLQLDSLQVPLNLSVERVLAAGGRLWVTIQAGVGTVTGAEQGLGVAVKKKARKGGSR
jgi:hypothetical protein